MYNSGMPCGISYHFSRCSDEEANNEDLDFFRWLLCQKCHFPVHNPKALVCGHTACDQCLEMHFKMVRHKISLQEEAYPTEYHFYLDKRRMSCPMCNRPFYPIKGDVNTLPTNHLLQTLTFRERLRYWELHHRENKEPTCDKNCTALWLHKAFDVRTEAFMKHEEPPEVNGEDNEQLLENGIEVKIDTGKNYGRQENGIEVKINNGMNYGAMSTTKYDQEEHDYAAAGGADDSFCDDVDFMTDEETGAAVSDTYRDEAAKRGSFGDNASGGFRTDDEETLSAKRAPEVSPSQSPKKAEANEKSPLMQQPTTSRRRRHSAGGESISQCTGGFTYRDQRCLREHFEYIKYLTGFDNLEDRLSQNFNGPLYKEATKVKEFELRHGTAPNECLSANAIAINKKTGHIVIADCSLSKVLLFTEEGELVCVKQLQHPIIDCAFFEPCETYPDETFCVVARDNTKVGIHVYRIPFNSDPKGFLYNTHPLYSDIGGLDVAKNNYLVISIPEKHCLIDVMDDKRIIEMYSTPVGQLENPTHILVDPNARVFVSDSGNHRIVIFDRKKNIDGIAIGELGHQCGQFFYPLGLAMNTNHKLFVCDSGNYRIQVFNIFNKFESCPITNTFRIGDRICQDVKPVDCATKGEFQLFVLFRGRGFSALWQYAYDRPVETYTDVKVVYPNCCWRCFMCCCYRSNTHTHHDYAPIQ